MPFFEIISPPLPIVAGARSPRGPAFTFSGPCSEGGTKLVDRFVSTQDGLKLHVRSYGPRIATALPVVCLPGLARTGGDFEALATALASDPKTPRKVIALDSRGRGK